MVKKSLRLYTAVFGDTHFDWWKRGCLKSLAWAGSADEIDGATWSFLTKKSDQERIIAAVKASGLKIKDIEMHFIEDEIPGDHPIMGHLLLQGWLQELSRAITFNSQIMLAPPDTIFGNGTVAMMRMLAEQRDSVIFMAHPRVTPTILNGLEGAVSNAQLVAKAWRNLHRTWADAEVGLGSTNSYIGGVSWRFLSHDLYAVTHRLPTPYLINPTPEDIVYFKNQIHFGVIDHFWPHECLIDFERQRLVGSSDAAFCVEITPADKNIPPVEPGRHDEPDQFHRSLKHNKQNRMSTIIFRGSD